METKVINHTRDDATGRFIKQDIFTEEQKKFLVEHWSEQFTYKELVTLLNEKFNTQFSYHNVQKFLIRKCGIKKRKYSIRYTEEMMQWIKNAYEGDYMLVDDIVKAFNDTFNTNITKVALWSKASQMGIKKNYLLREYTKVEISWLEENISKYDSKANCFDAFIQHFNKDIDRVSFDNLLRRNKIRLGKNITSFKKGDKPKNTLSDGYEVIRNKGTQDKPYYEVYVKKDGKWFAKKNLVWIEHYGSIPKGKLIIRLDDDINNYDISNLAIVDNKMKSKLSLNGQMRLGMLTKAYIELYGHMDDLERIEKESEAY